MPFNRQHPGAARDSNQDLQDTERRRHRDPSVQEGALGSAQLFLARFFTCMMFLSVPLLVSPLFSSASKIELTEVAQLGKPEQEKHLICFGIRYNGAAYQRHQGRPTQKGSVTEDEQLASERSFGRRWISRGAQTGAEM